MGMIYRRKWKDRKTGAMVEGPIYWIQFYDGNGRCFRESSRSTEKKAAKAFLAQRESAVSKGEFHGLTSPTLAEMAQSLYKEYEVTNKRSLERLKDCVKHLFDFFGEGTKARDVTTDSVNEYIIYRPECVNENETQGKRI